MIELNASQLAPEVAALFLLGSGQQTMLQWHTHPKKFAKDRLDQIDNAELFGRQSLADEAMASAVRALLYLWNGWPDKAADLGEAAPDREQHYLKGLRERQLGHMDLAKVVFQQLDTHPIYSPLASYAVTAIGGTAEPLLKRFKDLIEFSSEWEPFLFVDLVEQALAGKLDDEARAAVCQLQCKEFEQLFRHCYEQALGEPIPEPADSESSAEQEARVQRVRQLRERRRSSSLPLSQKPPPEKSRQEKASPEKEATVQIGCPRCRAVTKFPESARGKNGKCGKCGTLFAIPEKGAGPKPPSTSGTVITRCPKCTEAVRRPESSRGQKDKCKKCGTVFLIPKK